MTALLPAATAGTAIVVFAKAPIAGQVKTRLSPAVSPAVAAQIYAHMLEHTVRAASSAGLGPVWLHAAPSAAHPAVARLASRYGLRTAEQRGDGLGERMLNAMRDVLGHAAACVLVGADCPDLAATDFHAAAAALSGAADLVLGPTVDGGYALIGARKTHPALFANMDWSTRGVAAETRRRAGDLGLRLHSLRLLRDIDEARDLALIPRAWRLPPTGARQIFDR